jgi:hypothetical protein
MTDQSTQADQIVGIAKTSMVIFTRGLATLMAQQNIPPEESLFLTARALAEVIGMSFAGDDDGVRKFRERCRVAFSAALHQAPVAPLPQAPPAAEPEKQASEAA